MSADTERQESQPPENPSRRRFLRGAAAIVGSTLAAAAFPGIATLAHAEAGESSVPLQEIRPPLLFLNKETNTATLQPYVKIKNHEKFSPETFPTASEPKNLGDGLFEYNFPSVYPKADQRPNFAVVDTSSNEIVSARFSLMSDNGEFPAFTDYVDWLTGQKIGAQDMSFPNFNAAYTEFTNSQTMDVAFYGRNGFSLVTDQKHIYEIEIFPPTTNSITHWQSHSSDFAPQI